MQLSSPVFIFLAMPLGFLLVRLLPQKYRNVFLLAESCFLIAWGSPRDALLVLLGTAFNWFTAREMISLRSAGRNHYARVVFISGIAANLACLFFFKYSGFAVSLFGGRLPSAFPAAPLGVSFYTFSALSYLTDAKNDETAAQAGFLDTALYLTFFPKFLSGPIVQFRDFISQLHSHPASAQALETGFARFAVGLGKKVLLADALTGLFAAVAAQPFSQLSAAEAWLGVFLYAFSLYFDFSGYSDMALGLSSLCGFSFRENFVYPYTAESFTAFWRRWHVSLGAWFRDYVYIPLGGSRRGNLITARNLLAVWLLTGLWHGAEWTFLLWGLYHAIMLLCEKFIFSGFKQKLPLPVNRAFTFLLVVLGWVPFFSADLSYAGGYVLSLIGAQGAGAVNTHALFMLSQSALWLAVSAVGCTPLAHRAGEKIRSTKYGSLFYAAGIAFILALSAAALLGGTAKSFLYAQF